MMLFQWYDIPYECLGENQVLLGRNVTFSEK